MKTIIISAFPACGKSYATEELSKMGYKVIDSDSSKFSWIKDEFGNNTEVRNPNFINDYMSHIKQNIGKMDFIFVSSHKDVRKALEDSELNYTLIYPDSNMKNEWIGRCFSRGSDINFCNLINKMFNSWIEEIKQEKLTCNFRTGDCTLNRDNLYIMDIIDIVKTHIGN